MVTEKVVPAYKNRKRLGTHHLIFGRGARKNMKKKFVATKSEKEVCWKSGQKIKKFVLEIDEKYIDQRKTTKW